MLIQKGRDMTQETDARATLVAKKAAAQESIPRLEKEVAQAVRVMADIPKGSQPQAYVDAAGTLGTAQALLEGAQGDIRRADKGLAALDVQEKRAGVVDAIAPITSLFANAAKALPKGCKATGTVPEAMLAKHKGALDAAEVKSVSFVLDATVDPPIASVKPSGGVSARAPRTGNGGGFSKRLYATPSGDLSQTDVFKSYALEAGVSQERYDAVLADPSNQGISHRGKAVASKMGFEEVTPA